MFRTQIIHQTPYLFAIAQAQQFYNVLSFHPKQNQLFFQCNVGDGPHLCVEYTKARSQLLTHERNQSQALVTGSRPIGQSFWCPAFTPAIHLQLQNQRSLLVPVVLCIEHPRVVLLHSRKQRRSILNKQANYNIAFLFLHVVTSKHFLALNSYLLFHTVHIFVLQCGFFPISVVVAFEFSLISLFYYPACLVKWGMN